MDKTLNETLTSISDPIILRPFIWPKFAFKAIGFSLLPIQHLVRHLLIKLKHNITYILFNHPKHSKPSATMTQRG
jgi:hypothetical protein